MKYIILFLILFPGPVFSQKEISDKDIKNKFLSLVKDAQVEGQLQQSDEFAKCRKDHEFKPTDSPEAKSEKLRLATECFNKNLAKKDPSSLKKLAEDFKLENYGLIKSKNINDITDYLSKKMTKSLTGYDPEETDRNKILESLKWGNKKIVDQKVFLELYLNILSKTALFEVSRFCFENLEIKGKSKHNTDFTTYWSESGMLDKEGIKVELTDLGSSSFFQVSQNTDISKKESILEDIAKTISSTKIDPNQFNFFFSNCQATIHPLCERFKGGQKVENSLQNEITSSTQITYGSNACLTLDRLRSIRTALKNAELVAKQFDEMSEDKDKFALQMLSSAQIYNRGNGTNEESLDDISNLTSADMLGNLQSDNLKKTQQECENVQGGSNCDEFLVKSDSLDEAINKIELEMNLKREIEAQRVQKIKDSPKELEKYLNDNGLFDLLTKLQNNQLTKDEIEVEIKKIYDARKVAEIESLKSKVGKRQLSEDDFKNKSDSEKQAMKVNNIKESREERARLAQVVMFNNILTSQLSLKDKETKKEIGRNDNAWLREAKGLSESGIKMDLFEGLQESTKSGGQKSKNSSVVGNGIIDSILGKTEEDKKNPKSP